MTEISEKAFQQMLFHYQNQPSLRLHIATQLMAGWFAAPNEDGPRAPADAAETCFRYADALIAGEYPEEKPEP